MHKNNRPQYLLSGLLKCGCCGGAYSKINAKRYGCSQARNKGESVCANKKTIKLDHIEELVLNSLQTHLMRDDLVKEFSEEYTKHMNKLQSQKDQTLNTYKAEQSKLIKQRENIIEAIKNGVAVELIKDELESISVRLKELENLLKNKKEPSLFLHPKMADRYREVIGDLRKSLNHKESRSEASEHLRALIEKIILTPVETQEDLSIDLYGDLAGILRVASKENAMKNMSLEKQLRQLAVNDNNQPEPSIELVAGARFELTTFGL